MASQVASHSRSIHAISPMESMEVGVLPLYTCPSVIGPKYDMDAYMANITRGEAL